MQITQRRQAVNPPLLQHLVQAEFLQARSGTRMRGENQRQLGAQCHEGIDQALQDHRVVDIRRAVQREHAIVACGIQARVAQGLCRRLGFLPVGEQGVDHHIADEHDTLRINALAYQVGLPIGLGGVEGVGNLIGQHPVDFLGHLTIAAAQAGLNMHHRDAFFNRDQGAGNGRVHIADHQQNIGLNIIERRLKTQHDLRGLLRM